METRVPDQILRDSVDRNSQTWKEVIAWAGALQRDAIQALLKVRPGDTNSDDFYRGLYRAAERILVCNDPAPKFEE